MVENETFGGKIFNICNYIFLSIIGLMAIYPMLYVIFASLSLPNEFLKKNFVILWRPLGIQFEAYKFVFRNRNILNGFRNTAFYVVVGTSLSMLLSTMASFVLSRRNYALKRLFTIAILFTMYFSGGLIPTYLLVKDLKMTDTVWSIIVPSALSTYNCIVLRTAFDALPPSLEESARIDGANGLRILFQIYIPLSIPTLAVIGLFYAVARWNAWFNAVIYLRRRSLYPLQLILRELLITSNADYMAEMGSNIEMTAIGELVKYATIVVATVPILLLYPFLQKYFVKGMMIGAVKG